MKKVREGGMLAWWQANPKWQQAEARMVAGKVCLAGLMPGSAE